MDAVADWVAGVAYPGASDTDRTAWLRERRGGVTATEMITVHSHDAAEVERLARRKALLEPDSWGMNRYMALGKKYEPVIVAMMRDRYGFEWETRVFHSVLRPEYMASPDGVRRNFDGEVELLEIKTSKKDLTPGGEVFERSGYLVQMMWQMLVLGARRCLFAWWQHDDDWSQGEPHWLTDGPLCSWVRFDRALAAVLEIEALHFLAQVDKLRAGRPEPELVFFGED